MKPVKIKDKEKVEIVKKVTIDLYISPTEVWLLTLYGIEKEDGPAFVNDYPRRGSMFDPKHFSRYLTKKCEGSGITFRLVRKQVLA